MEKNKLSIITVVKNSKTNIEKTIKSVLDQNYKNLEYIKRETLTQSIQFRDDLKEFIELKINNSIIKINIIKV